MSTIKFGIKSFKLKSYKYIDLGISENHNSKSRIEYHQNYFHLHFLPLFPTTKTLKIRKEDNLLYDLPNDLNLQIKNSIKTVPKTPWYSFSGPILLILSTVIYFGVISFKKGSRKQYHETKYELKTQQNIKQLETLNSSDYIKLITSRNNGLEGQFIKIEKLKQDSILIKKLNTNLGSSDKVSHKIKSYYFENKNVLDSIWIHKGLLRKAICTNYDSLHKDLEFGIDFFNDGNYYLISGIERIDNGPAIKSRGTGSFGKSLIMELFNFGAPCHLVKIENIEGDVEWTQNLPLFIKTNDKSNYFYLEGINSKEDSHYAFVLYLETENKELFKYHLSGKNLDLNVRRIE